MDPMEPRHRVERKIDATDLNGAVRLDLFGLELLNTGSIAIMLRGDQDSDDPNLVTYIETDVVGVRQMAAIMMNAADEFEEEIHARHTRN